MVRAVLYLPELRVIRDVGQDFNWSSSWQRGWKEIMDILATLNLSETLKSRTEALSGGQKKLLSIALELINNPPVFFLDEPTSGLDIVSAKQCLNVLHTLSRQGRTIVCTIHQPSASLFQLFDHVYVVSAGLCVYQGTTGGLVSFLSSVGLSCPVHYNPADYIIELSGGGSEYVKILSTAIANGQLCWEQTQSEIVRECVVDTTESFKSIPSSSDEQYSQHVTTSFTGLLTGLIFFQAASDGSQMYTHMKLCIGIILFHSYTWCMTAVLLLLIEQDKPPHPKSSSSSKTAANSSIFSSLIPSSELKQDILENAITSLHWSRPKRNNTEFEREKSNRSLA
ncbi:unnamed protein product [Timema podura]|uniref:Uncharacterized protein n=1 Tax=Timema podura TaxID=61482 RepID=A0ABN7NKN5_TIMPD|nr:unnamed protein product [Timema podura]